MTSLVVRLARAADETAVRDLRMSWGRSRGAQPSPEFDEAFATWWAGEGQRRLIWLALEDDQPIGMLNLLVFDRMPMPGRITSAWGYVANVFVAPDRRGRGIGAALLSAVTSYADEHALVRLVLAPSETSRSLYERHGFETGDTLVVRPLRER